MQTVKIPNLGCCFTDNEANRETAISIIDNFYNSTNIKCSIYVANRKLVITESKNIDVMKVIIPTLEVIEHDFY